MPKKKAHETVTPWISDEDYAKAVGQFRMAVGAILSTTYSMHGMDAYNLGATSAIVKLAEDFSLRCRGADHPIGIEYRDPRTGKLLE
jgi:hypothetical protein